MTAHLRPWDEAASNRSNTTMADDDFQLSLGRIGKDRPFRNQLRKALDQSGGAIRRSRAQARRFDGSRIGRGCRCI